MFFCRIVSPPDGKPPRRSQFLSDSLVARIALLTENLQGRLLPKVPARGFSCLWRARIWIGFRARWPQKGRDGSSQPRVRRNHVEHPFITTGMGFDSTRIRTNYASISQLATL